MGVRAWKEWLVENVRPVRWGFARLRNPELWRAMQAERWVHGALARARKHRLADFAFRDGQAYVVTPRGCELLYLPGRRYSALGMELRGGGFEDAELDVLTWLTGGPGVMLDVGANCGYHSIVVARANPGLRVHAFEPVPSTYQSLVHNCRHNGVADRVRCEAMAVGERPGTLRITTTLNTGNYLVRSADGGTPTTEVPVTTVDRYVAEHALERVHGIKCDVEGAELLVVRGAAGCLERDRPWLLLEIEERWTRRQGYEGAELVAELERRGYLYYAVVASGAVPAAGFAADRERTNNFLFVHRDSAWAERLAARAASA